MQVLIIMSSYFQISKYCNSVFSSSIRYLSIDENDDCLISIFVTKQMFTADSSPWATINAIQTLYLI